MSQPLSLLACYAHPDDEMQVAGIFARYLAEGARVGLVCATRGEVGEIAPGVNATQETLGQWREQELRAAMDLCGVKEIYLLGYRDSGMEGTPENRDPRNFINAPDEVVTGQLVQIIREVRPQVIVTFDPKGGYGHPDHIKIHRATLAAFDQAGDPSCYPEQLQDGLEPYAPQKLYWTAFPREFFMEMARYFKAAGVDMSQFGVFNPEVRGVPDDEITTRIDVSQHLELKERAWAAHASQHNPNSPFAKAPRELWQKLRMTENFVLARSRVPKAEGVEYDLFAGVRSSRKKGRL